MIFRNEKQEQKKNEQKYIVEMFRDATRLIRSNGLSK